MDAIGEERIDKRVIKHDKNKFVDKMPHFWQDTVPTVFDGFKQRSLIWSTVNLFNKCIIDFSS